jgi:hypothetical protein
VAPRPLFASWLPKLNNLEQPSEESDFLQTSIGFGRPMQGWSTDFNVSYNFETANLDNFYIRVNYYTDCLGLSAEYSNFNIYSRRSEPEIRFALYLRGLGEFGQLLSSGGGFLRRCLWPGSTWGPPGNPGPAAGRRAWTEAVSSV